MLWGGVSAAWSLYGFHFIIAFFTVTVHNHTNYYLFLVALRVQVNPRSNELKWSGLSAQRAFADFLLCSVILHLVVFNFMG